MTKLRSALGLLLLGTPLAFVGRPGDVPSDRSYATPPQVVVGTFDSRAVLMAYVASPSFQGYLRAQKADIDAAVARAKAAGDTALVTELDALGPAMQHRVHLQGFGTAPVDDILARVADRLPGVATAAGVDILVSKWALRYRRTEAEVVDVTEAMAGLFAPDEATMQRIRQLVATDPVPADQLEQHKH